MHVRVHVGCGTHRVPNPASGEYFMMGGVGEDIKATSTISVTDGWLSAACMPETPPQPSHLACCFCFPEGAGDDGSSTNMYSSTFTLISFPEGAGSSCDSTSNSRLGSKG